MPAATWNGSQVFGLGPVRFTEGRMGRAYRNPLSGFSGGSLITDEGKRELRVTQRGRLVESSEAALQARIVQLRALTEAPAMGTLRATALRTWNDVTMLEMLLDDRLDKGRRWSVGYTIEYARLGV